MKLLTRLREQIPGLALRTTFISGFPGESQEQHRELVQVRPGGGLTSLIWRCRKIKKQHRELVQVRPGGQLDRCT